jgi:hypothetical protein
MPVVATCHPSSNDLGIDTPQSHDDFVTEAYQATHIHSVYPMPVPAKQIGDTTTLAPMDQSHDGATGEGV